MVILSDGRSNLRIFLSHYTWPPHKAVPEISGVLASLSLTGVTVVVENILGIEEQGRSCVVNMPLQPCMEI